MTKRIWICVLAALASSSFADYTSRAYGPKGRILVRRPVVLWQLRANNSPEIESTVTKINGIVIPSSYDRDMKAVVSDPGTILKSGRYSVEVTAVTSNGGELSKNWSFEVAADAISTIPDAVRPQYDLLGEINAFRRSIGLPDAIEQPRLMAAAQSHADYLELNKRSGHIQQEALPRFAGVTPLDRAHAFGYVDGIWEVVHSGSGNFGEVVANLVSAPYHRLPFLQPGPIPIGTGASSGRAVAMFGMLEGEKSVICHPHPGQTNVPPAWNLMERPDPLRIHSNLSRPTGYPIVLSVFDDSNKELSVKSATLETADGEPVDIAVNTPANDNELSQALIIIPKKPLQSGQTYVVKVFATMPKIGAVNRTWKFSTAKSPGSSSKR